MSRIAIIPLKEQNLPLGRAGEIVVDRLTGDVTVVGDDMSLRGGSRFVQRNLEDRLEVDVCTTVELTQAQVDAKRVTLSLPPSNVASVRVLPVGGPEQLNKAHGLASSDFEIIEVSGSKAVSWSGLGMDGILAAGDRLVIKYPTAYNASSNIPRLGLVGEYPMGEGSGKAAHDYSGRSLHAQFGNSRGLLQLPAWTAGGVFFTGGGDSLAIPQTAPVVSSSYTVAVVLTPRASRVTGSWMGIGHTGGGSVKGPFPFQLTVSGEGNYLVQVGDGTTLKQMNSGLAVVTNSPVLLVFVRNQASEKMKLYLNSSAPVEFSDALGSVAPVSGQWLVGCSASASTTAQEVSFAAIYDRSLSDHEVAQLRLALAAELAPRGVAIT